MRVSHSEKLVLVAGEALVDLLPKPRQHGLYEAVLGGSPFNVAIGLARLGTRTGFAGRLSRDANGDRFVEALEKEGVDISFSIRAKQPSPLAFVAPHTAQTGARYAFYLKSTVYDGASPLKSEWPTPVSHVHVGSFSALTGKHGEAALAVLKWARKHASSSFDPNVRPLVLPARDKVVTLVEARVRLCSIVKASDEDIEWLYPGRDPTQAIADWASFGPRLAILTRGSSGARAFFGRNSVVLPAPAIKIVDTVGAGDSFMAALLAIMNEDGALGAPARSIVREQVYRWLEFAIRAAAITCTRKGADPPRRKEIDGFAAAADKPHEQASSSQSRL
jgi:fructokinase